MQAGSDWAATFGFKRATSADRQSLYSPFPVLRENVILCLHDRVTRKPALGVVRLWRLVGLGAGRERTGRGVIIEHGPSPSAAVREPFAVLHHEVHVMQSAGHRRIREVLVHFRGPMDLCHLCTGGARLSSSGGT